MAKKIGIVPAAVGLFGLLLVMTKVLFSMHGSDSLVQIHDILPSSDNYRVAPDNAEDHADQDEPTKEFATIAKVSMLYGDPNPVYERALQSHIEHGRRHGYPIKVLRQKLLGRLWTKPAYLLSIVLDELSKPVEQRIKWIFWFDADTFLVNPEIPLEVFLPPEPAFSNIHFLCGNDHNGLNDGAFLLRVNDFALHMLAASLSVETFRPEVDLKYSEQSAIEHVVLAGDVYRPWDGTRYIDGYAQIPQRWMNAYMGARNDAGEPVSGKKKSANAIREGGKYPSFVSALC